MTTDPIAEATSLLHSRRDELARELRRIDAAIRALNGTATETPTPRGTTADLNVTRPSVRTMLLNLLNEEHRDWSTGEVIAEYAKRGQPVHGTNPDNAMRAAIADANKSGAIFRTTTGRYKAARWKDQGVGLGSLPQRVPDEALTPEGRPMGGE